MSASGRIEAGAEVDFPGVVVVGGGYAGLHAAVAARRAGVSTRVIDPDPDHDFVTRLAAVTGGGAPRSDASVSYRALGHDVHHGRAVRVRDGAVHLEDGTHVRAGAIVIATGSVPAPAPIPGLHHASTLRTAHEGLELRERIAGASAVVVIGGGATGVQLAGAISAAHPAVRVTLVDRETDLLAGMPRALGHHSARVLRSRGVTLRLGEEIERVDEKGAVLASGDRLDGLAVWAGGFASAGTSLGDDIPVREGRIDVDSHLRVLGWRRTFSAGDVAAHRDTRGTPLPMSAQIAVQAGSGAGANAARVVLEKSTGKVALRQQGWVLDLGGGRGVAELPGLVIAAPLVDRVAPLLHTAIDGKNLFEIGGLCALQFLPGLPHRQQSSDRTARAAAVGPHRSAA